MYGIPQVEKSATNCVIHDFDFIFVLCDARESSSVASFFFYYFLYCVLTMVYGFRLREETLPLFIVYFHECVANFVFQEHRTEIDARQGTFTALELFGQQLLNSNHYASPEIQEKLEQLKAAKEELER